MFQFAGASTFMHLFHKVSGFRYVATDQSLSPYSVTLQYCLHLIVQFVCFFRDGTSNLKSTVVRSQVCMVASFADIRAYVPFSICIYVLFSKLCIPTYIMFLFAVIISYCFTLICCTVLFHLFQLSQPVSLFALIMTYIAYVRTYVGLLCDLNVLSWCSLCMWCLYFTLPEATEWSQSGEPSAAHHALITEGGGQD